MIKTVADARESWHKEILLIQSRTGKKLTIREAFDELHNSYWGYVALHVRNRTTHTYQRMKAFERLIHEEEAKFEAEVSRRLAKRKC